jgi:ribosomal protein S27E
MRLIDADKLLEDLKKTDRYFMLKFDVENAPTVEVDKLILIVAKRHGKREIMLNALRPHGKWINQEQGAFYPIECSNCHNEPFCNDEGYKLSNYCSNCGADMRGEE